ncbi:MAG: hypothetical protein HYY67_08380 [Thaumarchaeota archaeon]|nr:hypothetical protein [Nitrososphaerota archaeon]
MSDNIDIKADMEVDLSHKEVVEIIRVESDQFPVCITKIVRKRVKLIGQQVIFCHRKNDGFDLVVA